MGALPISTLLPARRLFARRVVAAASILDECQAELIQNAFATVDRSLFLPEQVRQLALTDQALPIGFGQTSLKPSQLARALAIARIGVGTRVLEIGCGSGYSSAIMSEMGASVYSIEEIGMLAQQTRKRLDALYYHDILIRRADGSRGWHEHAPYDVIIFWSPVERIDSEVFTQLNLPYGEILAPLFNNSSSSLESHSSEMLNQQVILSLFSATTEATEAEMLANEKDIADHFRVYQIEPFQSEAC